MYRIYYANECIFESGKIAEYTGIMKKGACRRFFIDKPELYHVGKGISYNFYYKHLKDTSDNLGEPVIPPLSLMSNEPELFSLELIETKIIRDPVALLMPIAVLKQDMEINERLANAVYSIIFNKLPRLAKQYIAERTIAHERQGRVEYIAKLKRENHHVFANFVHSVHVSSYFGCLKADYSKLEKTAEAYNRKRRKEGK